MSSVILVNKVKTLFSFFFKSKKSPILYLAVIKYLLITSNVITPFTALVLVKGFGMSITSVGIVISLSSLSFLMGNVVGGILADLYRILHIMFFAFLFAFIALCWLMLSKSSTSILLSTITYSFFAAMPNPIINSLMSKNTNVSNISKGFSTLYIVHNAASATVYFLGGQFLSALGKNFLYIFLLLTLVSIPIVFFSVKKIEKFHKKIEKTATADENCKINGSFYFYCFLFFILSILNSQFQFMIPSWINENFPKNSSQLFGYVGIINGFAVMSLSSIVMKLTKKNSTVVNLALAALFYGLGFIIITYVNLFNIIFISTVVWTVGEIVAANYFNIYIGTHSPERSRARFYILTPLLLSLGKAVWIPVVAFITHHFGYNIAWTAVVLVAGFCVLLTFFYVHGKKFYEIRNYSSTV